MIEVLDLPTREVKGPPKGPDDKPEYFYLKQTVRHTKVDHRGLETVQVFDISVNPGKAYPPAADYVVHPNAAKVKHFEDRNGRERICLVIPSSPPLIRIGDLIAELSGKTGKAA